MQKTKRRKCTVETRESGANTVGNQFLDEELLVVAAEDLSENSNSGFSQLAFQRNSYTDLLGTVSTIDREPLDAFASNGGYFDTEITSQQLEFALDSFKRNAEYKREEFVAASGVATGVFLGATAAGAIWLVSGSSLVALMASATPIWANFDALHVLNSRFGGKSEDDRSLTELIQDADKNQLETEAAEKASRDESVDW
jgi:hypothetical protein